MATTIQTRRRKVWIGYFGFLTMSRQTERKVFAAGNGDCQGGNQRVDSSRFRRNAAIPPVVSVNGPMVRKEPSSVLDVHCAKVSENGAAVWNGSLAAPVAMVGARTGPSWSGLAQVVVENAPLPLLVLCGDLTLKAANAAFLNCFGLTAEEILDKPFRAIAERYFGSNALPKALRQSIEQNRPLTGLEIDCQTPHAGARQLLLNASHIESAGERLLLLSIEDVTERKIAERVLLRAQSDLRKYAESTLLQSKAALRRSRGELRALTASLLTAQEEERRRVSRELHDDLSQQVAMLEFDVERMEQNVPATVDELRAQLREIRNRVGSLSNDLRRIAYELHPSVLDHLGLAVALRSYSGEFSRREQMPVTFTCRRLPEAVPQAVSVCLYRVAQEAFRNIGKHAGKSPVKLSLVCKGQQLHMTVRDSGAGFDPASARGNGGLGIVSMHERVRLVHGSFSIQSSPGNGTLLTIKVPLEYREAGCGPGC